MILEFVVPGRPTPWKRPEQSGRRRYPNKDVKRYQDKVRVYALEAIRKAEAHGGDCFPLDGPIACEFTYYYARPKGTPRSEQYPARYADIDNLEKAFLDAMSKLVYRDDRQVVSVEHHKRWAGYCHTDPEPRVRVAVWDAGNRQGASDL